MTNETTPISPVGAEDRARAEEEAGFNEANTRVRSVLERVRGKNADSARAIDAILERKVMSIDVETYQGPLFRTMGYHYMEDRYGSHDGELYIVEQKGGQTTVVVHKKDNTPIGTMPAVIGGFDLRQWSIWVYDYDKKGNFTQMDNSGAFKKDQVSEETSLERLLQYFRQPELMGHIESKAHQESSRSQL